MNVPISTLKTLDLAGIEYKTYVVFDDDQKAVNPIPPASKLAILTILEDSIGKMQCVLTKDHFIDLTMLCEILGRNLRGIATDASLKIAHSLGMEKLSSLPGLTNYPGVVSPEVLTANELYFESGKDGVLIHIEQKGITSLFQHTEEVNFSRNIEEYRPALDDQMTQDEEHIKKAVVNFTTLRIKQRLETTLEIPPMPETSRKIVQLRVDPDAGVAELASLVETDPSLAAQVVSWAASPYYAAPGKISSVHDAVIRVLGFDLVINLALGLSLGKSLDLPKDGALGITPYWKQAVYAATTAELVCRQIPKKHRPEPGLAYLSGLLHNFGYLIFGQVFPPHLSLINRYIEANPHACVSAIEYFLVGVTRDQLAAWLFKSWSMPEEVVTAIRWQNSGNYNGPLAAYPSVLFIANQILHSQHYGTGPEESVPQTLMDRLELHQEELNDATQKIWDNMAQLDNIALNLGRG